MARTLTAGAPLARASSALILLHGRGAGAEDILGLGAGLGLPDVALIAPEAPGRSWWPTSFLAPSAAMEAHVEAGMSVIDAALNEARAAGLTARQLSLAGFSQGACLALEYAARRGGISGVFGLSGGLVGTGDAEGGPEETLYGYGPKVFDYGTDLSGSTAFLEVHEADPHIPLIRAEHSARVLRGLGAEVTFRTQAGAGHGVGEAGIAALRAHLNRAPA
ncbi:MAG: phospholipase [Pseudomonadota bacterium]